MPALPSTAAASTGEAGVDPQDRAAMADDHTTCEAVTAAAKVRAKVRAKELGDGEKTAGVKATVGR